MHCEVYAKMVKHEQDARGWLRLYSTPENVPLSSRMGDYALMLQRARNEHGEECELCKPEAKA